MPFYLALFGSSAGAPVCRSTSRGYSIAGRRGAADGVVARGHPGGTEPLLQYNRADPGSATWMAREERRRWSAVAETIRIY
jgi:hypothetical protein